MKNNALSNVAEHLRTQPTFAGCTRDDIEALLLAGAPTVIPSEWAFMQQSTPADAAYVLLNGSARIYRYGVPVATVDAGQVVGETALLNHALRNATVTSLEQVKAIRIERSRFDQLVQRRPNIHDAFTEIAAARLAAAS